MDKKFQELDLTNAFLFSAALEDSETCRLILEIILGFPISHVKVRAEHSMLFSSDFRSIRLDIYASDDLQVEYNIEMQNENEGNLAKRGRFHQAEMDVLSLKPGEDFNDLPPGYVVFICAFDPFGAGLYRYTFENTCAELGFPLHDGTKKIFLNTKGTNDNDVPEDLVHFLHYVGNSTDEYVEHIGNSRIRKIHNRVTYIKKSREWEGRFMKFEELLKRSENKGRKEEQTRMLQLMDYMIKAGETQQLAQLKDDPAFLQAMLEKYHLLDSEDNI
ncbi:MAG: Rpn family recombination-promoting nuclease/putative transposase [Lachnospiraceae bacterium]|nr:Rpn family recombination-promoting nuclease/putative transposase [Lachnospiraceae bacterium]